MMRERRDPWWLLPLVVLYWIVAAGLVCLAVHLGHETAMMQLED